MATKSSTLDEKIPSFLYELITECTSLAPVGQAVPIKSLNMRGSGKKAEQFDRLLGHALSEWSGRRILEVTKVRRVPQEQQVLIGGKVVSHITIRNAMPSFLENMKRLQEQTSFWVNAKKQFDPVKSLDTDQLRNLAKHMLTEYRGENMVSGSLRVYHEQKVAFDMIDQLLPYLNKKGLEVFISRLEKESTCGLDRELEYHEMTNAARSPEEAAAPSSSGDRP